MSKRPASEPPTWFWIVTAVTMNAKFFEPSRSAMSAHRRLDRAAEARLGEHALELLLRRILRLLDQRLDALLEAVAGLERRRHGHQQVGELLVERGQALARLALHEADRQGRAEQERADAGRSRAAR